MIVYENMPGSFTEVTGDLTHNDVIVPRANLDLWNDAELEDFACYRLYIPSPPEGKILNSYTIQRINGTVQVVAAWVDAPPAPVPQAITPRQARLALAATPHGAGTLLDVVEAAVASSDKATQITWEFATEIRRDNALISTLSASLGLSSATIDQLFRTASTL